MTHRGIRPLFALFAVALFASGASDVQAGRRKNRRVTRKSTAIDFTIKKGRHYDSTKGARPRHLKLGRKVDRQVSFQVLFTSSAAYRTQAPSNQSDCNKLMGVTTNRIHHTSVRLCWSWDPAANKMSLGFYGYIKGERINQRITKVALNQWVPVTIRLHNNGLMVQIAGQKVEKNQSLGFSRVIPTSTWILKTAYFGGQEKAPHDILVKVKDIAWR